MTDTFSESKRSWIMSRVKSSDTTPEMLVRSLVHRLGFRFRLHARQLPGRPDIVLARHRKVIFVHGCFWHGHGCPRGGRVPKTNTEYWRSKIAGNVARDKTALRELRKIGWRALVVWECELQNMEKLTRRVERFMAQT